MGTGIRDAGVLSGKCLRAGGSGMDYRLYLMRGGRIRDVVDIHAADDSIALSEAGTKAGGFAAELWCEDRRIASFSAVSAA